MKVFDWEKTLINISQEPNIHDSDMDAFFSELTLVSYTKNEVCFYVDPILLDIFTNKDGKIFNILEKNVRYSANKPNIKIKFTSSKKLSPKEKDLKVIGKVIGLNESLTFENFLYTDDTKALIRKAKMIAEKPDIFGFPVFIYGPPGSGKTHLINAIGNELSQNSKLNILYIQANDLADDVVRNRYNLVDFLDEKFYDLDVLIIDDFQNLEDKESTLDNFFKIFEKLKSGKKTLIVSSDKFPEDYSINDRFTSRLQEGLSLEILTPDVTLKKIIFLHLIEKNEFICSDEVALFIAKNASNLRELTGYVNNITTEFIMLDPSEIENNNEITMSIVLNTIRINDNKNISLEKIVAGVANYFGVSTTTIKSKSRIPDIVYRKRIAVYLSLQLTNKTNKEISNFFNYKDHTAIVQIKKDISKKIIENEVLRRDIENIEVNIKNKSTN